MDIITRSEWGSTETDPPGSAIGAVDLLVVHHTVSPALGANATVEEEKDAMRGMQRVHVQTRRWDDIGYNFVIAQSGRVYEGRGKNRSGAHDDTINHSSNGVAFLINGNDVAPSKKAWASFLDLKAWLVDEGSLTGDHDIAGHHEKDPTGDTDATSCPGDKLFAKVLELRGDQPAPQPEPAPAPEPTPQPKPDSDDDPLEEAMARLDTLDFRKVGSNRTTWQTGGDVKILQGALMAHGFGPGGLTNRKGRPDGLGGPATRELFRRFQERAKANGSYEGQVDEICGPLSWAALITSP